MEQKKTVKLSEGTCCAYCCGDCGWSEPGGDSSGKIWCTRNKAYYYHCRFNGNRTRII